MDNIPTVSVIIPVFNGAKYVLGAIESIFDQTFKDWEIIVVDDGSTDNTKEVLEPLVKENKIIYVYQQNKGVSAAYNTGTRAAKGKYIKYLDADDILYPEQLERQVNHINSKSQPIVSVTDFDFEFPNNVKKAGNMRLSKTHQLAQFIKDNPCPGHTLLVPRALIEQAGAYDEDLLAYEDTDLWVRIILLGVVFEKIDYTGCCYRILGGSISSNVEKMYVQRYKFFEKLNTILLKSLDYMDENVISQLLSSNILLIHMCFARKMDPSISMPAILNTTKKLYQIKMKNYKKRIWVPRLLGIKTYALIKYYLICFKDPNYHKRLLTVAWRDEKNH